MTGSDIEAYKKISIDYILEELSKSLAALIKLDFIVKDNVNLRAHWTLFKEFVYSINSEDYGYT